MSLLVMSGRNITSVVIEPWHSEPLTNHVRFLKLWLADLLMTEYWSLPQPSISFSSYKSGAKHFPCLFANGRKKETNLYRTIPVIERR